MAEKRKFAALADLSPVTAEPSASSLPVADTAEPERGRGRPATGKRSNPEWKLYSHYLKRQTQRAAVARLQQTEDGRDLSDLLQQLLENWLKN